MPVIARIAKPHTWTPSQSAQLLDLWVSGTPIPEISAILDITYEQVRGQLRRTKINRVHRRKRGPQPRPKIPKAYRPRQPKQRPIYPTPTHLGDNIYGYEYESVYYFTTINNRPLGSYSPNGGTPDSRGSLCVRGQIIIGIPTLEIAVATAAKILGI